VVVRKAKEMGARSVAYTFVEPVIFYEYMVDIGACAKRSGLLSLVHSNGFINPDPLQNLCTVLDAANIDLKGFTETFYSELCGGELGPVLKTLKALKERNTHLEITNLVGGRQRRFGHIRRHKAGAGEGPGRGLIGWS